MMVSNQITFLEPEELNQELQEEREAVKWPMVERDWVVVTLL